MNNYHELVYLVLYIIPFFYKRVFFVFCTISVISIIIFCLQTTISIIKDQLMKFMGKWYYIVVGGTCEVIVIVVGGEPASRVQILNEAVCISRSTNSLGGRYESNCSLKL